MDIEYNVDKAIKFKEEGNVYFKQGQYTKALEFYERAIQQNPSEATFYQNKAACYLQLGRYLKCLQDCKKALERNDSLPKVHRFMAQCYLSEGKISEAKDAAQKARQLNSQDQNIINLSDSISLVFQAQQQLNQFMNMEDYEQALKKVEFIQEKCPKAEQYKMTHIELLIKNNKLDKAQQEINENYVQDNYLKALILFYKQQNDKALQLLRQTQGNQKQEQLKKIIQQSDQIKNKGNEALKQKQYPQAIQFYQQALKLDSGNKSYNAIIYSNLGLVYMKQDKYDEALKQMNLSIKCNPQYFKAYLRRGEIYSKQEKYDLAISDYHKVKEIDSSQDTTSFIQAATQKQKKKSKKDFYEILGVSKSFTPEELKKAYKKKALQWHPDRHRSKSEEEQAKAQQMFKDVNEAYSTLSDASKKRMYDMGGEDMFNGGGGMPGGFSNIDPNDIFKSFFGQAQNQDDDFKSAFGGGNPFASMFGGGGAGPQGGGMPFMFNMGGGGMPGGMGGNMGGGGGGGMPGGMGGMFGGPGGIDISQLFGAMGGGMPGAGQGRKKRR